MGRGFKEDDLKMITEFLNFLTEKATFQVNQKEIVEYYKKLAWFQQSLIPLMESYILEIKQVKKSGEPAEEAKPEKTKKPKSKKGK